MPPCNCLDVLLATAAAGPSSLSWQQDGFAAADGFDGNRYRGLTVGSHTLVTAGTLLVRSEIAEAHVDRERRAREEAVVGGETLKGELPGESVHEKDAGGATASALPHRFHGVASLDPERLNRDFGHVAQEVVSHLTGLLGTEVEITVEITARNDDGFPDATVRNVTENAKTLRFTDHDFEER